MQLKSKRVGGEKQESLTLTKTETALLGRACDLLSDIRRHSDGNTATHASNAEERIVLVLQALSQEEPA